MASLKGSFFKKNFKLHVRIFATLLHPSTPCRLAHIAFGIALPTPQLTIRTDGEQVDLLQKGKIAGGAGVSCCVQHTSPLPAVHSMLHC